MRDTLGCRASTAAATSEARVRVRTSGWVRWGERQRGPPTPAPAHPSQKPGCPCQAHIVKAQKATAQLDMAWHGTAARSLEEAGRRGFGEPKDQEVREVELRRVLRLRRAGSRRRPTA